MAEARTASRPPASAFVALGIVYAVWGSTFLAMRIAVREGAGWPPFIMGGTRVLLAGVLLLGVAALSGRAWRVRPRELAVLAASGTLIWVTGHGVILWSEQWIASGLAALLFASVPLWIALYEAVLDRRAPSRRLLVSLALAFAGILLLTGPSLGAVEDAPRLALVAPVAAAAAWGAGALLQKRRPVEVPALTGSGWQQLTATAGFLLVSLALAEPRPTPTPEAWGAWIYLVVFGSLVAFTAMVHAIRHLPPSLANTYAFVNPVVALFLGALVLGEPLTTLRLTGAGLVVVGVAVQVMPGRRRPPRPRP